MPALQTDFAVAGAGPCRRDVLREESQPVGRVFDIAAIKRRSGIHLLVLAALVATLFADLSRLSKAETERIWLPFEVWLTAAGALLAARTQRWWLGVNVIGALLLNHLILTNW